jgi:hypothetical protein
MNANDRWPNLEETQTEEEEKEGDEAEGKERYEQGRRQQELLLARGVAAPEVDRGTDRG